MQFYKFEYDYINPTPIKHCTTYTPDPTTQLSLNLIMLSDSDETE